jgi:GDP-D-mannose 3',5'-epimerase
MLKCDAPTKTRIIRRYSVGSERLARILVTGGGGFIGSHLAKHLHDRGHFVRVADLSLNGHSDTGYFDEEMLLDLRGWDNCLSATRGIDQVYNLAANMGGIGFITQVRADIMRDNLLMNVHMLEASKQNKVKSYLFSSSACVYPGYRQEDTDIAGLKESDAYPAGPDTFYGWEKLTAEKMCEAYAEDYDMDVRVARYHNIYGPNGTYKGGREKSPAAICRKVAEASDPGTITIWGDGKQTRSFCYIDDAVEGTVRLMESDFSEPLNIGSDRMVTVDQLTDIIIRTSGKRIRTEHDLSAPQGVRGRNADISLAKKVLGWVPKISLESGLASTYQWIAQRCEEDRAEIKVGQINFLQS